MEELIGFISGNDKRDKILGLLGSQGPLDEKLISKRTRMVPKMALKILDELMEKGLVEEKERLFY